MSRVIALGLVAASLVLTACGSAESPSGGSGKIPPSSTPRRWNGRSRAAVWLNAAGTSSELPVRCDPEEGIGVLLRSGLQPHDDAVRGHATECVRSRSLRGSLKATAQASTSSGSRRASVSAGHQALIPVVWPPPPQVPPGERGSWRSSLPSRSGCESERCDWRGRAARRSSRRSRLRQKTDDLPFPGVRVTFMRSLHHPAVCGRVAGRHLAHRIDQLGWPTGFRCNAIRRVCVRRASRNRAARVEQHSSCPGRAPSG